MHGSNQNLVLYENDNDYDDNYNYWYYYSMPAGTYTQTIVEL